MGGETTGAGGGGFRARMEHYLYSGEKKHVLAGIAIFAAVFGVPWYFMTRAVCRDRPLAPAKDQRRASSRARFKTVDSLGEAPLNTQSFRCFQMVQAPSMMREFNPFLASSLTVKIALSHQASKEESTGDYQDYMEKANKARSERLSSGQPSALKE